MECGADRERVVVLRNGVDATRFRPLDRSRCREELGLDLTRKVIVSVGFLVGRKGHDLTLRALAGLEEGTRPQLVIAGDGPEEGALRQLARELGIADQVRFLGGVEHDALAAVYSAADVSVLASSREGWPNVLLESMACGTPVVATAVHGSVEAIPDERVGLLVRERTVAALSNAIRAALLLEFDREHVRRYAEGMGWEQTADGLHRVFHEVLERPR
ncbi:MAG: glycosyltransferase [Planctomycetota bacterium]